ncbi:MAG: enoyl-CoA hydratase/isomerase family protein [Candidatus Tectomicrobia bacterium]|uniref:Enoyl-CoA hydratase/isomerase family protein n=1 Tax=Tectimicrobiota bacterium TaxID=2528274 RepID=A0A933LQM8_UNCTE|nr:enoyl-CoA hydratase/isomerase family protein [Candidatus Tectomicrobia bacterium]
MAFQFIKYEKKGHLAYVTINRPEVFNALHPPANHEMSDAWDDFNQDPECWIGIVTGAGDKAFSAGNDLKFTAQHGVGALKLKHGGFGGLTSRFDCFKPIIAAVNGFALGGGFEIALASDIIIAADHARLGLPEPTVGLMAGAGGVHRLPRQIPEKIAMGMILTGRHITAQEALSFGIVNQVVPLKDLMATAEKWAEDIMKCAPLSVRASKESAMLGLNYTLEEAMTREYACLKQMHASEDTIEGPKAFAEKRKPQWKGR